ncbi:hypothetical protein F0562_035476 [Nyssa sinensis]|uniref:Uncharacterized protein n=1 Tax=Nyssa sinensis TaxID=561372 RepID=A0A5J5A9D0_9ASTE|nr:hypothetical protein F0562_035476 [Nyssa sinensis]
MKLKPVGITSNITWVGLPFSTRGLHPNEEQSLFITTLHYIVSQPDHIGWVDYENRAGTLEQYYSGMHFTSQPIGHETKAIPMHAPHCPKFNLSVSANFFKNSTITT